jgi:succinate dehydrogenase / fumarate reductase membrane anchor subunit
MTKSAVPSDTTALRDETMLRHVRQLGSARDGLSEWRLQRLTATALIPLGLYFVASVLWLATSDRITAAAWLSSPVSRRASRRRQRARHPQIVSRPLGVPHAQSLRDR